MNGGGGVILTERLSRLLAFDPESAWIECEAGLSLRSLLAFLVPRGFFLPVVPGTQFVTVGGAIAADVHGKNQHLDGTIGRHVLEMRLMVPSGEVLRCAPDENADVFDATVGGMGLTGTVVSARLKLLPVESAFVTTSIRRAPDLAATLAAIDEDARSSRYSVAWIDGLARGGTLGRAVLIRGDHVPAGRAPSPPPGPASPQRRLPRRSPCLSTCPASSSAPPRSAPSTGSTTTRHGRARPFSTIEQFFFPLDRALHWNRLYGRRGFVQYQALLPRETAAEGCARILEEISRIRAASFLAVLKTTGPAGRGLLSFPLPGITLALDIPNVGEPLRPLARRLDEIVLGACGRLYLAKDALTDAPTFAAMYPRLGEFRAVRGRARPFRPPRVLPVAPPRPLGGSMTGNVLVAGAGSTRRARPGGGAGARGARSRPRRPGPGRGRAHRLRPPPPIRHRHRRARIRRPRRRGRCGPSGTRRIRPRGRSLGRRRRVRRRCPTSTTSSAIPRWVSR